MYSGKKSAKDDCLLGCCAVQFRRIFYDTTRRNVPEDSHLPAAVRTWNLTTNLVILEVSFRADTLKRLCVIG
jgi:hypothetical protein